MQFINLKKDVDGLDQHIIFSSLCTQRLYFVLEHLDGMRLQYFFLLAILLHSEERLGFFFCKTHNSNMERQLGKEL